MNSPSQEQIDNAEQLLRDTRPTLSEAPDLYVEAYNSLVAEYDSLLGKLREVEADRDSLAARLECATYERDLWREKARVVPFVLSDDHG